MKSLLYFRIFFTFKNYYCTLEKIREIQFHDFFPRFVDSGRFWLTLKCSNTKNKLEKLHTPGICDNHQTRAICSKNSKTVWAYH